MASSGRRSLLEEAKEAEIPKGKFPTAEVRVVGDLMTPPPPQHSTPTTHYAPAPPVHSALDAST
jgi:hypothetical protein